MVGDPQLTVQLRVDSAIAQRQIEEAQMGLFVAFMTRIARLGRRRCAACGHLRICYAIEVRTIGDPHEWQAYGQGLCAKHAGIR